MVCQCYIGGFVCSCVLYVWHKSCDDGISLVCLFSTSSVCFCGICVAHVLCVMYVVCVFVCVVHVWCVCLSFVLCGDMCGVDVCFEDLLVHMWCLYL